MNIRRVVVTSLLLAYAGGLGAQQPAVQFGPGGVTVGGMKPGTRIAWMAMTRKRVGYHIEVEVLRGVDVVTPNGSQFVEMAGADLAHTIWTVADISNGKASRAKPPAYSHSERPVPISATAGADHFTVDAPVAEVMYVRPRFGVWSFGAHDGTALDTDATLDGTIRVALTSLVAYKGNPHPPERVEPGDIILVLNTQQARAGQLEVAE
jgi:hypothetical protein